MVIVLAGLATYVWVQYLPNGSAGFKQQMCVTDFKLSPQAGSDAMKFSISFASYNGVAPAAV
jgi:hypothetical protein